jgi:hypothetical protein
VHTSLSEQQYQKYIYETNGAETAIAASNRVNVFVDQWQICENDKQDWSLNDLLEHMVREPPFDHFINRLFHSY